MGNGETPRLRDSRGVRSNGTNPASTRVPRFGMWLALSIPLFPLPPLLLARSTRALADYDAQKWALLQTLAAGLLGATVLEIAKKRRLTLPGPLVLGAMVLFLGLHVLLTFTISFETSVSWSRALEVATFVVLASCFSWVARDHRRFLPWFLAGCLGLGAVIATYGIAQFFGIDFPTVVGGAARKPVSTIGNTNTVGAVLAPLAALAVANFLGRARGRIFSGTCVALVGFHLYATSSRGAWIAAAVGVLSASIVLFFGSGSREPSSRSRLRTRGLPLLATAILLGGGALAVTGELGELGRRIGSIVSPEHNTNRVRYHVARSTLDMVLARPLAGWGPGCFRIAFPPFRSPREVRVSGYDRDVDTVHNEGLELLAEGGLVLGLSALTVIAALFVATSSLLRAPPSGDPSGNSWIRAALVGMLAALLVESLFRSVLRNPTVVLFAAVTVGGIASLGPSSFNLRSSISRFLAGSISIVLALFLILNARIVWRADWEDQRAQGHLAAVLQKRQDSSVSRPSELLSDLLTAQESLASSYADRPFDLEIARKHAELVRDLSKIRNEDSLREKTIALHREILGWAPFDRQIHINLSVELIGQGRSEEARSLLEEFSGKIPWDPRVRDNLGLLALDRGDSAQAEVEFAKMVEIDPEYARRRHQELLGIPGREPASILIFRALLEDGALDAPVWTDRDDSPPPTPDGSKAPPLHRESRKPH